LEDNTSGVPLAEQHRNRERMIHFIPYVNNFSLLVKAYESCRDYDGPVIIIDNRDLHSTETSPKELGLEKHHQIFVSPAPLSTSQTMNWMWRVAAKYHPTGFFTWQHSDASFDISSLLKLHDIAHSLDINWGVIHTHYDTLCAYRVQAISDIGGWDYLRFQWYFLDNDLHIRLHKAGFRFIQANVGHITHVASSTIKTSSERNTINNVMFPASEILFHNKHPDHAQYTYEKLNYLEL